MSMTFGKQMKPGDPDQRTRITVYLVAARQKVHRNFFCTGCGKKIAEIDDDLIFLSDSADATAINPDHPAAVSIECGGSYCRTWFEFVMRVRPN